MEAGRLKSTIVKIVAIIIAQMVIIKVAVSVAEYKDRPDLHLEIENETGIIISPVLEKTAEGWKLIIGRGDGI